MGGWTLGVSGFEVSGCRVWSIVLILIRHFSSLIGIVIVDVRISLLLLL